MSPTIGLHATKVKHFFFHNINWSITSFLSVWNSSIKDSVSLNSALIGQMTQSVVIGLLCSDWSDGPVCFHWSTLLWLVRWSSLFVIGLLYSDWSDGPVCFHWSTLLWLVRWSSLFVIGLLCSDWSDGPVCFDWSTLFWLDRWSSLLWLVYFALIGQMTHSDKWGPITRAFCNSQLALLYTTCKTISKKAQ